jgi:hypothetical protein
VTGASFYKCCLENNFKLYKLQQGDKHMTRPTVVRADDLGHAPSIQRARLGAYRPIWEEFKTKQHHRKNYRVYSIYFSVIFNYAPNIFYKNYKKNPFTPKFTMHPSHQETLQNLPLPPSPLHYTDLLPSPHLPPLASPCEKNTCKRKKKRFLYLWIKIK